MRQVLFLVCVLVLGQSVAAAEYVATRTLKVGSILKPGDLRTNDKSPDAAQADEMVGLEVRRAIYAGRSISPSDLGPPTLVRRNDIVVMTYRSGALKMRTEGRALDRGGVGEVIDVMTLSSRQTVRARVLGAGRVEVRR